MKAEFEDHELDSIIHKLLERHSGLPPQKWFTLRQACEAKRGRERSGTTGKLRDNFLTYCRAKKNKALQPNGGKPDGRVGGKDVWDRQTIKQWLEKDDGDLMPEKRREKASR